MLPIVKHRTFLPNLVDDFFNKDVFPTIWNYNAEASIPAVNVVESKEDFKIEVAAPGLQKDDFKIDLHNNVLTILSEKDDTHEEKDESYMRREFSYTSFKRSFALPHSVNTEKVTATHKDGILKVVIPKKEEAKEKPMRRIEIA